MATAKCKQCGAVIKPGQTVCETCGAAVNEQDFVPVEIKCKQCGGIIKQGEDFCGSCGAAVNEADFTPENAAAGAAQIAGNITEGIGKAVDKGAEAVKNAGKSLRSRFDDPEERKKLLPKITAGVAAVLVIIIAIVLVNVLTPPQFTLNNKTVSIVSQEDDEIVVSMTNGKNISFDGVLDGSGFSVDRSKAIIYISEDGQYDEDYAGSSLYLIGEKSELVSADNVIAADLSTDGNAIIYATDYYLDDETYTEFYDLVLWKNGKTVTLADDTTLRDAYISPDGSAVFFSITDEDDDSKNTAYLYANGKIIEVDDDITPIGVSNGGKYIYYSSEENYYVQTGEDANSRRKLGENIYSLYFNKDNTELLYYSDPRAYITVDGGEKHALTDAVNVPIFPENTAFYGSNYGVKTFANVLYYSDEYDVIRITKDFDSETVVKGVTSPYVTDDNQTLFYIKNYSIRKINAMKTGAEETTVAEDAWYFKMLPDGSAVWYVNYDGDLYYKKGNSDEVRVDTDVDAANSLYEGFWTLHKGKTLYYISDGELFYTENGKKGTRISGFDDDIYRVSSGGEKIYAYGEVDEEYYYESTDGINFEPVENNSEL
jgi:RNA polymerase subunit RPABC4/transcription elongation factor Spt4